jgi:hypothetical protein
MSTKTNFKRVALVAVASLGLGVLTSIAPASAAIEANDFNIATAAGLNACKVDTTDDYAYVPASSQGVSITTGGADSETAYVRVSGPGIISSYTLGTLPGVISEVSPTEINITTIDASDTAFVVKPTGVGTIKVTYAVNSTSAILDQITIYVVAACGGGVVSAGDSYYTIVNSTEAIESSAGDWVDTAVNTSNANLVANEGKGYVKIKLYDVYGSTLSSGALISTVTGPCLVGLAANNGTLSAGKGTTAVLSATGANHVAIVEQKTAGVGGTCAVTTTFDGVTVGTQTFTMQGAPAVVTVSDVTVGATGGLGYYRVTVQDAAGNNLPGKVISASSTETNNAAALASGIISDVQSNSGAATSSSVGSSYGKTQSVTAANVTTATSGSGGLTRFACVASKGGTAKLTVRTPVDSAATAYATSAPFTVACGGALATWTIGFDKAIYAPGEIATMTLTGKDSNGFAVSTFTALSGVEYSTGGMTAVTAPTNNDVFNSGIGTKTYTFSVGTTEGSFVGTFKTTGSTDTSAKTTQYKIAAPTGAVSNADVLKAIVSLIASINKQIAALQKALLKK